MENTHTGRLGLSDACRFKPLYSVARNFLFLLDAETGHKLALNFLTTSSQFDVASRLLRCQYANQVPGLPTSVMGLKFPNPVGLAAGLDKNAEAVDALTNLGFGWLELGTVTPRPQPGNPKKRIFRIPSENAIINRLGFNSIGLEAFIENLKTRRLDGIIGINIGINAKTPIKNAQDDYELGLTAVYPLADYITINVSSPNTPDLRTLQTTDYLDKFLSFIKAHQSRLADEHGQYVPIALKIAPDLDDREIELIAKALTAHKLDGVIATNTTVTRPNIETLQIAKEVGGLSGAPLRPMATNVIRKLYAHLQGEIPIIGVGGIFSAEHAWEKLEAGAELVQIYSGLIFRGPALIREIVTQLQKKTIQVQSANFQQMLNHARNSLI